MTVNFNVLFRFIIYFSKPYTIISSKLEIFIMKLIHEYSNNIFRIVIASSTMKYITRKYYKIIIHKMVFV